MRTIKINRKSLLEALRKTYHCLGNARCGDMFWDYHFYAADDLAVMATNGEQMMTCYVDADITMDEPFSFSLGGYQLRKALALLDDEEIEIECHQYQIEVKHAAGTFLLQINTDYYEQVMSYMDKKISEEEQHTVELEIPGLIRWIDQTAFAMADDELRPVMNGVLFEFDGEHLNLVSSDGHKLAAVEVGSVAVDFKQNVIMPKSTINLLRRILPKTGWIDMEMRERTVRLAIKDADRNVKTVIFSSVIDGRYPNWRSVIPEHNNNVMTVERKTLLAAVKRAQLFAPDSSELMKLYLKDGSDHATIEAKNFDYECSANETVQLTEPFCEKPAPSKSFFIGFKCQSMIEILSHMTAKEITLNMRDGSYGCIFTQPSSTVDSVTYLLMPMYCND